MSASQRAGGRAGPAVRTGGLDPKALQQPMPPFPHPLTVVPSPARVIQLSTQVQVPGPQGLPLPLTYPDPFGFCISTYTSNDTLSCHQCLRASLLEMSASFPSWKRWGWD